MAKLFVEEGHNPGLGNGKAALAVTRNLILALVRSGQVRTEVIDEVLLKAADEMGITDKEANEVIEGLRTLVNRAKPS
jgi:hypothetical protein